MMQQDNLAEELWAVLLRLAAGQLTLTEWQAWWAEKAAAVKKLISPGDFSRLNRAPSIYGPNSFMEKCQVGAEQPRSSAFTISKRRPSWRKIDGKVRLGWSATGVTQRGCRFTAILLIFL